MNSILTYKDGRVTEGQTIKENYSEFKVSSDEFLSWIDITNPDEDELSFLKDKCNFNSITIDFIIEKGKRPQARHFGAGNYYFLVLNSIFEKGKTKEISHTNIYIYFAKNYLITIHWDTVDEIKTVFERSIKNPEIFKKGTDFLLYNIIDETIDRFSPIIDNLEDKANFLEELILKDPKAGIQINIQALKRTFIKLRRKAAPQRDMLNILLRHDANLISDENELFFMDAFDRMLRIFDTIENYQELLTSTMDLYISSISNKTNEIMKFLTIVTTIMMPMTVISGLYGMNFENMPELKTKYGYFFVLAVMAAITIVQIIFFKKKKWL